MTQKTKADVAYDTLRQRIITLKLEPGVVLDERGLSEELGIGRTPLREAFTRLAAEGLIISPNHCNSLVTPLNFSELSNIFEMRLAVEVLGAGLAAERATPAQCHAIQQAFEAYVVHATPADPAAYAECHSHLHETWMKASGNPYLVKTVHQLNTQSQRFAFLISTTRETFDIDSHARITQAIVNHQVKTAEKEMRLHIQLFKDRIKALL